MRSTFCHPHQAGKAAVLKHTELAVILAVPWLVPPLPAALAVC